MAWKVHTPSPRPAAFELIAAQVYAAAVVPLALLFNAYLAACGLGVA